MARLRDGATLEDVLAETRRRSESLDAKFAEFQGMFKKLMTAATDKSTRRQRGNRVDFPCKKSRVPDAVDAFVEARVQRRTC